MPIRDKDQNSENKGTSGLRGVFRVRFFSRFLTAVYLLSLVPVLYIARYAAPSADDFNEGTAARLAFLAGGFPAAVKAAFAETARLYRVWIGYFSSMFLTQLQPAAFGEKFYAVTPALMLASLSGGVFFFFRRLFVRRMRLSKDAAQAAAAVFLLTAVQNLPGRNEALYWYSGAVNYTFFFGLALIFLGALAGDGPVKNEREDGSGKAAAWKTAALSLLGFCLGGCNYMTALSLAVVLFFYLLYEAFAAGGKAGKSPRRLPARKWIPAAAFYLGFLVSVAAPGNRVRGGGMNGMPPVTAVLTSFKYVYEYCFDQWTGKTVLIGLMLCAVFLDRLVREYRAETGFRFPYPAVVFAGGICLAAANITPPLYAGGNIIAGRLKALIFLQYLLILALLVFYGLGFLRRVMEERGGQNEKTRTAEEAAGACFTRTAFAVLWVLFAAGAFFCARRVISNPYYFTSSAAAADLLNGTAAEYGAQQEARWAVLHDPSVPDAELEPFTVRPQLLYFSDITEDKEAWENRGMAEFYEKNSVILKQKGSGV